MLEHVTETFKTQCLWQKLQQNFYTESYRVK
jgi:hypothetical protein